jgi:polysaccharide pyruvyl transferase WcaK-like protein
VFVRDDRSIGDAERIGVNVERMPDLASLAIARSRAGIGEHGTGTIGMVARSLGNSARSKRYDQAIKSLTSLLGSEILTQSQGRGNDDPAYYASLGYVSPWRPLKEALSAPAESRPSATVSVRLHGALQSILAGVPSVHLSYERKGWGAFDDLGLSQFVHNAKSFDERAVADQVRAIAENPAAYWQLVEEARPKLLEANERLITALRQAGLGRS